jgi:hypothetical protein
MRGFQRRIVAIALGAALISCLSMVVRAQAITEQGNSVNVAVDDGRPVALAVRLLIEKYGYQITYEDPPYVYDGDLKDRYVNGFKDRVPAGGALAINFAPSSAMTTSDDMAGLLKKLLQAHAGSDQGGHFRVVQNGQVFHILPSEVKDNSGNWGPQTSILDVAISLPNKERTGMATLEDICSAVGAAAHANIIVGSIPPNVILPYRGVLSAENETARSVLLRALDGTNRKLTWIIMFDPSDKRYWLNIVWVPPRAPVPNPGAVQPAAQPGNGPTQPMAH